MPQPQSAIKDASCMSTTSAPTALPVPANAAYRKLAMKWHPVSQQARAGYRGSLLQPALVSHPALLRQQHNPCMDMLFHVLLLHALTLGAMVHTHKPHAHVCRTRTPTAGRRRKPSSRRSPRRTRCAWGASRTQRSVPHPPMHACTGPSYAQGRPPTGPGSVCVLGGEGGGGAKQASMPASGRSSLLACLCASLRFVHRLNMDAPTYHNHQHHHHNQHHHGMAWHGSCTN